MKTRSIVITSALVSCVVFAAAGSLAAGPARPKLVSVRYHTAYVPEGFDSNDQIQVVAEGTFPNTCYRAASPRVEFNSRDKTISIQPRAYLYPGPCLQMTVDWNQVVSLGILRAGEYRLTQSDVRTPLGVLHVNPAQVAGADDFPYAPISQAFVHTDHAGSNLMLTGVFSNTCFIMDRVIVRAQGNVITVQPVSKWMEMAFVCAQGRWPFEEKVSLPKLQPGRYLLHVRSLNGRAMNTLVDIP